VALVLGWPTLNVGQQMAYYKKYNPELLATLPPVV